MKRILFLVIVALGVAMATGSFAQNSVLEQIQSSRMAELKALDQKGLPPKNLLQEERRINKRYDRMVKEAMKAERQSNSSSTTSRKTWGASMEVESEHGSFSARTPNVKRGSEAYATTVYANANATLIKSMAANGGNLSANSVQGVGLKGVIANKNKYHRDISVRIQSSDPGRKFDKSYNLGPSQIAEENLLPGNYKVTITEEGGDHSPKFYSLKVLQGENPTHYYQGHNVFWYVYGGSRAF